MRIRPTLGALSSEPKLRLPWYFAIAVLLCIAIWLFFLLFIALSPYSEAPPAVIPKYFQQRLIVVADKRTAGTQLDAQGRKSESVGKTQRTKDGELNASGEGNPVTEEGADIYARRGQIGDAFGILNSLFSMLAVTAAFFAFYQQRDAMREQARAIRDQIAANDAADRARILERYHDQLRYAIDVYTGLLQAIQVPGEDNFPVNGRQALRMLFDKACNFSETPFEIDPSWVTASSAQDGLRDVSKFLEAIPDETLVGAITWYKKSWASFYLAYESELDCLFRAWYHVYKVIDEGRLQGLDIGLLWNCNRRFRAQLSVVELHMILMNELLSPSEGFPSARELCNRYAIFDNHPTANLPVQIATLREVARRCYRTPENTWLKYGVAHAIHPLDKRAFSSTAARLSPEWKTQKPRQEVEP